MRQGVCPGYLSHSAAVRPAGLTPLPQGTRPKLQRGLGIVLMRIYQELFIVRSDATEEQVPRSQAARTRSPTNLLGETRARPNHQTGQAPSPPHCPNTGGRLYCLRSHHDPHRPLDRNCHPSNSTQPPSPTLLRAESLQPLHCAKGSVRATFHTPPPSGQQD